MSTDPGDPPGPTFDHQVVTFRLDDPQARFRSVALSQELQRPRVAPEFIRTNGSWEIVFPRRDALRMEYQFRVVHFDGREDWICDPANPLRAPGAFGDRSVLEFPGYERPRWLPEGGGDHQRTTRTWIPSRALRSEVEVHVWASRGTRRRQRLPLLIVNDGPEYARLGSLLTFVDHFVRDGTLPPLRVALLQPVERNDHYSASHAYARALAQDILPALAEIAPTPAGRAMRIGMGASLGALAMLHAHRTHPAMFGALFLQSGSYFRRRFDPQESGFAHFDRISRFVGRVLAGDTWSHPLRVAMTCGSVEENLANNRAVAHALGRQGYDTKLHVNKDAHNWVAWRDTFDPHLLGLLREVWA